MLGLISKLKERHNCKIILLLNRDELDANEKNEFQNHIEKVCDQIIQFSPTSQYGVGVIFSGRHKTDLYLSQTCIKLGISNIRILDRIRFFAKRLWPLIEGYVTSVQEDALFALALMIWCTYQPTVAPSIDFIKHRRVFGEIFGTEKNNLSPEEGAWNALLNAAGFLAYDETDQIILESIQKGYFDKNTMHGPFKIKNDEHISSRNRGALSDAWKKYRDSFDDDTIEVVRQISEAYYKHIDQVDASNLDAAIVLFKNLGLHDKANELLNYFMKNTKRPASFFNLQAYPFADYVKDPDLISAFNQRYESSKTPADPKVILSKVGLSQSWGDDDLEVMLSLSTEDYYTIFKNLKGDDRRLAIAAGLQFKRISNANSKMIEISKRVTDALKRIGLENPPNASRIQISAYMFQPATITIYKFISRHHPQHPTQSPRPSASR